MDDIEKIWWKAPDWAEFLRALGIKENAIHSAKLVGKRIELRMSDMTLHVVAEKGFTALDGGDGGYDFAHVCPPDCGGG